MAKLLEQVEQPQDVVVVDVAEDRDVDPPAGPCDVDEDGPERRLVRPARAAVDEDAPRLRADARLDHEAVTERCLDDPQPETGTPVPHGRPPRITSGRRRAERRSPR